MLAWLVASRAEAGIVAVVTAPARAIAAPFRCGSCERDEDGRIKRSRAVVRAFEKATPKPGKGWVADHIVPLACADVEKRPLDDLRNLQWQSPQASKAKDRWERELCDVTTRAVKAKARRQRIPEYLK